MFKISIVTIKTYSNFNIIDPSVEYSLFDKYENVTLYKKFFENNNITKKYDIVVSSHFFEHVYEPSKTLENMKFLLKDNGYIYMSIPNLEYDDNTFLGLSFEHTFHINSINMKYLCEKNNLTISNVYKYKKKESLYNVVFNDFFYKMFINQISNMKSNVTKFNLNYNSNKKYFIFGCHCKTQVYLQIGLKESYFEFILDNDNNKHDLFFMVVH
jgi:2-polyprenyl-3-methyl-5-hydroxy-6-metoxy-1,4-benzoquinol methylase